MTDKSQTTATNGMPLLEDEVAFVERSVRQSDTVIVVEKWVPAEDGEKGEAMLGNCKDGFKPMKLEGRYLNGKRI